MKTSESPGFRTLITLIPFLILLSPGCQLTRGHHAVLSKKVNPHYFTYEDKSIIFIPFIHFGQKEFYDNLRDSIIDWKKDGYTIFYEQVTSGQVHLGLDSTSYDRLIRKFRRINRDGVGTAEDYEAEAQQVFKKGIAQPDYIDLGIDSTDIHADITFLELVNKIEELYGEIKLDSCDYATPLDSTYTCSKGLKMKKLDPIYVDYRNAVVVEKIVNSELNKIVVIFGIAHKKGIKKLLKEKESASKKQPQ